MREEYVNPFLAPAKLVWERELKCDLDLEEFAAVSDEFTTDDVTVVIRVKGLVEGNVLYGFDIETAKAIAGTMMGEDIDELDEIALSDLGELANMISGNAATELAAAGFFCQISPPLLLQPAGSRFTDKHTTQILVVLDSDLGPLHVRIDLAERPDEDGLDWLWQRMYKQAK